MQNKKSAKDIAFEKERVRFRTTINQQNRELAKRDCEIRELKELNQTLKSQLEEKEDWIQRLLEYMDLTKEEFEQLKEEKNIEKTFNDAMSQLGSIFNCFVR